ncbi:MAG: transcriptional regulator [Sulfurimonas sp. RIFCSPHIGHO2_12_FULL_36_9]|uniref:helix-turn-helix transcriptional regulator n=1 Tax=Sulfurimonas sp. RIFCSPLOWO2_12_36_12 TaxID=1802253 RepID=UPI0008C8761C|nr:WYL domain-containing protein [Sulfurimonas sp. RIFCSPLOWO2_12_36_12]OHD98748.1 MAG: transcriptional regulator [Sulfurimonas sp. RIFCSPHIGHO2_12_FULL_36_9]OHE00692.1 MAG: transcriptional regulator [Sulfurimonas sp. RIFCSPLOWO2_02_FULL_36_28]OHE02021.1 MAG: transcriptional regulator [Sulfurimonas sp. RIFCSPLOWO2_12_36_12]
MAYKHDYDKILTRLTFILSRLNDGEALSVTELAKEFNTSDRTIQRDFNERLLSFPIYQENKKWKMQDGFRVEKTNSLEDEIILDIMEKITEGIGGKFATKSRQLLSKIKNQDFNPIYAKLNIEDISDKFADIQIIETAIKEKREVECSYNDERHDVYVTTLQPLKIANYEGFWYLIAIQDGTLKKYYLKNISNVKLTKQAFITEKKLENLLENSISVWFQKDAEPYEVKIFANKIAAKYFQRRPLPTQSIETLGNDGAMEFVVKITHEMEIIPIVKYWLPHMRVVEPQWIQDMIDEDLRGYLTKQT